MVDHRAEARCGPPKIEFIQKKRRTAAARRRRRCYLRSLPWTTRAPTHKSTQWSYGHEQSPSQRVPATSRDEVVYNPWYMYTVIGVKGVTTYYSSTVLV